MYTLDPTKSTGKGIKKTYGYIAKTDEEGILKKRKEFWGNFFFLSAINSPAGAVRDDWIFRLGIT
jgi:hypothetical protein